MVKLKTLKPLVAKLPPRLGRLPNDETARYRQRDEEQPWRRWYGTSRWQRLRREIWLRDLYTCQMCGRVCGKGEAVADHKTPHKGDEDRFWDADGIWTICKPCHDGVKQREEKRGAIGERTAAIHPKWLRPSTTPLVIVCGPPAAGKTTYVRERAGPADLVIDLDEIAGALSGQPGHTWNRDLWFNKALWRRNELLASLSRPSGHPAAWFIVAEAKAMHRQWWADTLKPQCIVVLETAAADCIARAQQDPDRDQGRTKVDVMRWWAEYRPRTGDQRV